MTLDTLFAIVSMNKPLTAVAALQLVEQGRLVLDEPLHERLPDLSEFQVLDGFNESGVPRLRPARSAITLRRLLTHTAGFAYPVWSEPLLRWQQHMGGDVCRTCSPRRPQVWLRPIAATMSFPRLQLCRAPQRSG